MDFNARGSQQLRTAQNNRNGASSQHKQKKDEGDEFMRLPDREIAGCISDIGVPFSPADLQQPQPALIQKVFEWFAELLMNATRETVEPAMREAARDVCGEELMDIVPVEMRNLMGFFASLRKLLVECGINDFAFSDLTRPTHPRLVKLFSYIINFVRFRESQAGTIDAHFHKLESTKSRIETLYASNTDLSARLESLRQQRVNAEADARDKTARIDALKTRLFDLKRGQERVSAEMERARNQKAALVAQLEDRSAQTVAAQQDVAKLAPYAAASRDALQSSLTSLSETLADARRQLDGLERRARALAASADAFGMAAGDVRSCTQLLQAIATERAAAEEEKAEAGRRTESLGERGGTVRELEHKEAALQKQLARWVERTEAQRKGAEERTERAGERMRELGREHARLVAERGERGREVERRRVKIEQTEKKMADLKEIIEAEVHAAHDEYLKMDSHIRLYITEMEQALGDVRSK